MDHCFLHCCPVCSNYIDQPTALYCSPQCRRVDEAPPKPRTKPLPSLGRITIPRDALELSSTRAHLPSTSHPPIIPSFPSPRLVRNPHNHSSPEELAYDMAHVAETHSETQPTPASSTSPPPAPPQPGPSGWTVRNENNIISWIVDVNNHTGPRSNHRPPSSTISVAPSIPQHSPARFPLPSPAFAISACRPAPPTLSTASSDLDDLFVPSSRTTIPSSPALDDTDTSILTSAADEGFSSDGFDDDNLTNPSSLSPSLNEMYGDATKLDFKLQTWMAPSNSSAAAAVVDQPPVVQNVRPQRVLHHPSQSNPLDLASFARAHPVDFQPSQTSKATSHLDSRTRTTSRTTSCDSSYDSCDGVGSRARMVQGRRHSSVTAGMRLVEILECAGTKGQTDHDALWSSRGRTHGRLSVAPRLGAS